MHISQLIYFTYFGLNRFEGVLQGFCNTSPFFRHFYVVLVIITFLEDPFDTVVDCILYRDCLMVRGFELLALAARLEGFKLFPSEDQIEGLEKQYIHSFCSFFDIIFYPLCLSYYFQILRSSDQLQVWIGLSANVLCQSAFRCGNNGLVSRDLTHSGIVLLDGRTGQKGHTAWKHF